MRWAMAVVAALALCGAPGSALASEELRVEAEGAGPRTLTVSGLGEPDVRDRTYTVHDAAGERSVTITGHSLDRVLGAAEVDPYRFGEVRIGAAGGSVTLSREEVTDPETFPEGPPVFYLEDGQAHFLRPAAAAGDPGHVVAGGGGPITLRLVRATRLAVRAAASEHRVRPGEPVTFTATVTGAPTGEHVEISWYFDDGRSDTGRRVTHRFRRRGSYDVVVGATTTADEPGADASVTVQVGRPAPGPSRKGGGTSRASAAPDSGAATGHAEGAAGPDADRSEPDAARPEREPPEPPDRDAHRAVEGIELADLWGLSGRAGRDALRAARRGRPRDGRDPDAGVPAAVWWALGGVALLGFGGWREAAATGRGTRPRGGAGSGWRRVPGRRPRSGRR